MGVKLLSKLLKTECGDCVKKVHLQQLYNKKICIDTSIYLYRFKSMGCLLEKFYLMCSIFKQYNIIPLFVFDGKPPEEKRDEINRRRETREKNWKKIDEMKKKFGDMPNKHQEKKLESLKRSIVRIRKEDIVNIKTLIKSMGFQYIEAHGEADKLCAALVKKNKVYGVLTEDMDLFAYGCAVVFRYISLINHTIMQYNLKDILKKLRINLYNFQLLCVMSGTDYLRSNKNVFYYLNCYKKSKFMEFGEWLKIHNNLSDEDYCKTINILNIYQDIDKELKKYPYFAIKSEEYINKKDLFALLEKERFIFI